MQDILDTFVLNGPIEIDEAVIYKVKRGQGRLAKIILWVFGMKCRLTKQVIIYPVIHRTKGNIIPLIQKHVAQGGIIFSDRFSCYFNNRRNPPQSHLEPLGFTHLGINHSIHFVSEVNGLIHTNTIERTWRSLKRKFKTFKPRTQIHPYISQFVLESRVTEEERHFLMLFLLHKYNHIH